MSSIVCHCNLLIFCDLCVPGTCKYGYRMLSVRISQRKKEWGKKLRVNSGSFL